MIYKRPQIIFQLKKILLSPLLLLTVFSCKIKEPKSQNKNKQPNIILLLTDDLGYGELGSYGQEIIKTPFLDSLASESMRFTNFYAGTSVCSPSRASLMTGMHTGHVSIRGNNGNYKGTWGRIPLLKSEKTIGEMLQTAGYQTAMIGKWHLGRPEDTSTWAKSRGFNYAVQEQWGISETGQEIDERVHWVNNNEDSIFYDYRNYKCLDEFRTNFALEYLNNKKSNKPFFLFMSYRIPHAHEFFIKKTKLYEEKINEWPEIERLHAARITMLDAEIRRLFNQLKSNNELDNTLIIFTSDNGPHRENHHNEKFFKSSGELRGFKRHVYEGGIRVPMFAYWKGHIKPLTTSVHQATFYDIMPTLAELTKAKIPNKTDGISFLPELLGKPQKKHNFLYWEIQEGQSVKGFRQAIRMEHWKAVRYGDNFHTELYDLSKDLQEQIDVSKENPKIVNEVNIILKRESKKNEYFPFSGGVFH